MRFLLVSLLLFAPALGLAADQPANLPSWHDGPVKTALLAWVTAVTDETGSDFIPVPERVAVLDNDGTSWCERPSYGSTEFQVNLTRSLAAAGRIDGQAMPFKAWLANDRKALRNYGLGRAYEEMNAAFAGLPVTSYRDSVRSWLGRTRHERFDVPLTDLYYQPMHELRDLLLANGFQVWIVTGSVQDFVRSYLEDVFLVPPEQVIGTWTTPVYSEENDPPTMVRGAVQTYNGHEHKPANIEMRIGRRPVFAAGNSDNDQPMCRWAVTGPRRGLAIWIHHDDSQREYAYDGGTVEIASLVKEQPGAWRVSMKNDWRTIFKAVKK